MSQSPSTPSDRSSFGHLPSTTATTTPRRPSSMSSELSGRSSSTWSLSSNATSPRVQLVPHAHRASYDSSLSQSERDILDSTSFDASDLSSQDFDFEDIFTYDKPQRKLASVVEVSTPIRERDWQNFSYSHYTSAAMIRQKVNRTRAEMYVKSRGEARKR